MSETMQELEAFDLSQVISRQRENQRMKRDLAECQDELHATMQPPTAHPSTSTSAFNLTVNSNTVDTQTKANH